MWKGHGEDFQFKKKFAKYSYMILIFSDKHSLIWLGLIVKFWLDSALIAMAIISHFIGDHVVDLTFRRPFEITSLRHLFIQVLIMSISEPKISVPDKMT